MESWSPRRLARPANFFDEAAPSTEQDDRGSTWLHYQELASLQEYVLVSQSEPRIERYRRLSSGAWEYTDTTSGVVTLATGALIDIAVLYDALPD